MSQRYWLVHPNGGRQLIDPGQFDLERLAEHARQVGGRLVVEAAPAAVAEARAAGPSPAWFEPPASALGPLFRDRLARFYAVRGVSTST